MLRIPLDWLGSLLERRRGLAKGAALLAGALVLAFGSGEAVDQNLRIARDSLRSHSASGEVHIVEIDARSLQRVARWPWPRRNHARLIDRLHGAGARSIAFDVEFSALSNPADDAALAAALRRAGGSVILPTLRQRESSQGSDYVDALPATPFREHSFLASVNVVPGADGYVREMLLGLETGGVPRPSLAAMVAESPAEIGRSFDIDYSIDPTTIPRHSFIDVVEGRVPASVLAGKRIIVGATAVEIWDRYAVPNYGVIPGVVIQALAAETLIQGPVPGRGGALGPLLAALALIFLTLRKGSRPRRIIAFALGALALLALPLLTEQFFATSFALAPALAALAAAGLLACAFHLVSRFREKSMTDAATGLPNLGALHAALAHEPASIVVAQIERFTAIAAGLGGAASVNLVQRVADRLGFGNFGSVYRIDERSLAWIETGDAASTLVERLEGLVALMRSPVDCGRLIDVSLSFGIADPVAGDPRQQVANAALAAAHAATRPARWERFAAGHSEETEWHLSLLGELETAMKAGQVWNAYQPKLDIASRRIVGVEALVRWNHPERGMIRPDAFIPVVEEAGRIRDLTLHVLDAAIADARRWRGMGHDLVVAVNVSTTLLLDADFVGLLRDRLAATDLPADRLVIEVTETAAMGDPDRAIAALQEWRALGLNISIDDYGTGQSSLAYLQKLPADELKIDMSFVRTLADDARNAIMVRSTIALAHELGMTVVAEGVEDGRCLELLAEMGCDTAQGYHISRPVEAEAIPALLDPAQRAAA